MKDFFTKKRTLTSPSIEMLIVFFSIIWGGIFAAYVYSLGLTTTFVDQNSHLNIARLISDSMTPGISQIGFWPPLLHIMMAPFAGIRVLFETGLAAPALLVPLFASANIFLYRILKEFTGSTLIGIAAVLVFATNPYILYYSATPMTEVLFLWATLGTAYFLLRWLNTQTFSNLIYLGILTTLASITRFEGLLIVLVVGVAVIGKLIQRRKSYTEIEGMGILFGLVASLGVLFTLVYGLTFAGNPIEFISGQWSAPTQQKSIFLPAVNDFGLSLFYMGQAVVEMIGPELILISLVSFIAWIFFNQDNGAKLFNYFTLAAVLGSPFIFDLLAIYSGSAVMYLADLPPFEGYFNERYGLYVYGFIIFTIFALLGHILKNKQHIVEVPFRFALVGVAVLSIIVVNSTFLFNTAVNDSFAVIREGSKDSPVDDQRELGQYLSQNYDGGKILITRALHNAVTVEAGIALKHYILESNYLYYDQALNEPWLFARYVVSFNPAIVENDPWRRDNEQITKTWVGSNEFNLFYDKVFENSSEQLYVLKTDAVITYVSTRGIDAALVPSLNTKLTRWDTGDLQDYLDSKEDFDGIFAKTDIYSLLTY